MQCFFYVLSDCEHVLRDLNMYHEMTQYLKFDMPATTGERMKIASLELSLSTVFYGVVIF